MIKHNLLLVQGLVAAQADWGSNWTKNEWTLLQYQLNKWSYGNLAKRQKTLLHYQLKNNDQS